MCIFEEETCLIALVFFALVSEVGEGDKNESTTCSSARHGEFVI